MRALSAAALQSLADESTEEIWLCLLTIEHDSLDAPFRIVDNIEDIVSNGITYIGLPFKIELPAETPDGPGDAVLEVDNVDRQIVEAIRSISSPPTVSIEVILASNPDVAEFSIQQLVMRDCSYDVTSVKGSLRFEDLAVEPVAELITGAGFPGLF